MECRQDMKLRADITGTLPFIPHCGFFGSALEGDVPEYGQSAFLTPEQNPQNHRTAPCPRSATKFVTPCFISLYKPCNPVLIPRKTKETPSLWNQELESFNRTFESSLNEGQLFERRAFHSAFALEDQKSMAAFAKKRKATVENG